MFQYQYAWSIDNCWQVHFLIFIKCIICQSLQNRIKALVQWNRNHENWSDEWLSVLVGDKKKFKLDGPDGCAYYWHYSIHKESQTLFSRQQTGCTLMVWWDRFLIVKQPILLFWKVNVPKITRKYLVQLLRYGKLLEQGQTDVPAWSLTVMD